MTASAPQGTLDRHAEYDKSRLFFASSLALAMAGINAAMRANTAADLQRIFLDPIDRVRSAEMIGTLLGLPFLGYAVMIAISSPMLDWIGMGRLLPLSGVLFSIGMAIMMFADGSGIGSHSGDCRADVVSLRGDSSCGSTDYLRRNLAV